MTIKTLQVGPIMTNCYLLCDEDAKVCATVPRRKSRAY